MGIKQRLQKYLKRTFTRAAFIAATFAVIGGGAAVLALSSPAAYSSTSANVPGGECDNNAIIRCGVSKSQLPSAVAKLDAKGKGAFAHAGILNSSCKLNNTVMGSVTKDNRVVVGGKTVANNVYTYGRQYMPGSQQITGGAYRRHPSVSFRSSSITAWVCMEGKEFKWAVISTCGNPVTEEKPNIKIEKKVDKKNVIYDEVFNYTIKATNTGNVKLTNVKITDTLPKGVVAVKNPDSRKVTFSIASLNVGASKSFTFKARATVSAPVDTNLNNVACIDKTDQKTKKVCDDVDVKVKKPIYTCDSLTMKKVSGTTYKFTAKATAKNGATIKQYRYNFGDGKNQNTKNTTVEHKFPAEGTFKISVTVAFTVKGKEVTKTSDKCKVTLKLVKEKKPVYTCDLLTMEKVSGTTYRFTTKATAKDGATIKEYRYNFGYDNKTATSKNGVVTHTFPAEGTFNIVSTVAFTVNGKEATATSSKCKTTLKLVKEKDPIYRCDLLTMEKVGNTTYRFTTAATAQNGATVKEYVYNFGDGTPELRTSQATVSHTFPEEGTFNIVSTVVFMVNGKEVSSTSIKCKTTLKLVKEKDPVYSCDLLKMERVSGTTYKFATLATAENGATIKQYRYDFDDGSDELPSDQSTVEHTFPAEGTFNIVATVDFDVNGETISETSDGCKTTLVLEEEEEKCPIPGKEHLPKDDPACKEDEEKCPIPGKEHLPKDHEDCKELPDELPSTGFANVLGIFAAVSIAGTLAYRVVLNPRRY